MNFTMAVPRVLPASNQHNRLIRPTCQTAPIENKCENLHLSNAVSQVGGSVCRAVELDDAAAYNGLMLILAARLTERQRAGIAYAALSSLPDDHAYKTASLAIFGVWNGEVAA